MYDVVVVGAGVIGCAIARELSKYKLSILVLEKENDLCSGTSKGNSAIIHAGFDADPMTLKGKLNRKSNELFDQLSKELDFPFRRNGALVLGFSEEDKVLLSGLKKRGEENGVRNLEILNKKEILDIEPNVNKKVLEALYAPTSGIVCPFNFTIALGENAYENGVDFLFNSKVIRILKNQDVFLIETEKESIECKIVVNAAGIYGDEINNLISNNKFYIKPRKGQYNLYDKAVGKIISKTLFQLPTEKGKGVLVTPTIHGNLLVGPNAIDIIDKDDLSVTAEGLYEIVEKGKLSSEGISNNLIITSFAGLRAKNNTGDFIIGESKDVKNFINAASIDSPGLTCAPLIGEMVRDIIIKKLEAEKNENFKPNREGIKEFNQMKNGEKHRIIKENPKYGKVVCRCELVTEGEILESIKRPLGAKDLDGIKRRTRAGSGRCQCGFCSSRIMEILSIEKNINLEEVTKFGQGSEILDSELN